MGMNWAIKFYRPFYEIKAILSLSATVKVDIMGRLRVDIMDRLRVAR